MVNNLIKALFGMGAPLVREVDQNVDGWWLMLLEFSSNSQPNPSDLKSFTQKELVAFPPPTFKKKMSQIGDQLPKWNNKNTIKDRNLKPPSKNHLYKSSSSSQLSSCFQVWNINHQTVAPTSSKVELTKNSTDLQDTNEPPKKPLRYFPLYGVV